MIDIETKTVRELLREWFSGPLGRRLQELERQRVHLALSNLFGYHLVQLGNPATCNYLENSRITHKEVMQMDDDGDDPAGASFIGSAHALALASDSMDVVFMPHVLEFASNPHQLLREADRTLIGHGHLVIVGFNPWSLWGLWRVFLAWRDMPPWCGHFYGLARIKDWLSLLDFELVSVDRIFYRPPLYRANVMQRLQFLEKLGKYCWSYFGGVYIIVAKKRVIPLNPIKMNWRDRRNLIATGLAEPSARVKGSFP